MTTAPAGQNIYGCPAANTWSLEGSAVPQSSLVPSFLSNSGKLLTTDGTSASWQSLGGDVTGTPSALTVSALLGRPLSATAPLDGQLLKWNGTSRVWEPAGFAGDLSGSPATSQVTGLRGRQLSSATPADGQALKYNASTGAWEPAALGGDVSGSVVASRVVALRGWTVSTAAPADGQLLKFNGTTNVWEPIALGGDISGNPATARVAALQGRAVSTTAPADGQLLKYNATKASWEPIALAGDVNGAPAALTVAALQGRSVSTAAPGGGQFLAWSSTASSWTPTTIQVPSNFRTLFSSATSVTVTGAQHNMNTPNLVVSCYDTSSPPNLIEPNRVTIDPATYNVNITFANPQSGNCVINGSGGVGVGATALVGNATLTFATIANGSCSADQNISVPGSVQGNGIAESWPALPAGFVGIMRVIANDTVAVRVCNFSGAGASLPALSYGASVVKSF